MVMALRFGGRDDVAVSTVDCEESCPKAPSHIDERIHSHEKTHMTAFHQVLDAEFAALKARLLAEHESLLAQATSLKKRDHGKDSPGTSKPNPSEQLHATSQPTRPPHPVNPEPSMPHTLPPSLHDPDSSMPHTLPPSLHDAPAVLCESSIDLPDLHPLNSPNSDETSSSTSSAEEAGNEEGARKHVMMFAKEDDEIIEVQEEKPKFFRGTRRQATTEDFTSQLIAANLLSGIPTGPSVELSAGPVGSTSCRSSVAFDGAEASRVCASQLPDGGKSSQGEGLLGSRSQYLASVSQVFQEGHFDPHQVWMLDYELMFGTQWHGKHSVSSDMSLTGLNEQRPTSCISKLLITPDSWKRILWDFICILLNLYDMIVLPLSFFNLQHKTTPLLANMSWFTRIFWTLDIPASFLTGFVTTTGDLENRFDAIAWAYIMGWFPLDIILVSLDWLEFIVESMVDGSGALRFGRGLRAARTMRMIRLFRVARMSHIIKNTVDKLVSDNTRVFATLFNIMFCILLLSHIIACLWYAIGIESPPKLSWLSTKDPDLYSSNVAMGYKYVTSLLWALSQTTNSANDMATPMALGERTFTAVLAVLGFMISTAAGSMITSAMTRFDLLKSREASRFQALNQYMSDRGISTKLTTRVQRNAAYVLAERRKDMAEVDVNLLWLISEPLREEIHFEVNGPFLETHPFFMRYCEDNRTAMMKVSHLAVTQLGPFSLGDIVYNMGEVPEIPRMYFVIAGELRYARSESNRLLLERGAWISEHSLWVPWRHCGMLQARSPACRVLCLNAEPFQHLVARYFSTPKHVNSTHPSKYAIEFAKSMNESDMGDLSDVTTVEAIEANMASAFPAEVRFNLVRQASQDSVGPSVAHWRSGITSFSKFWNMIFVTKKRMSRRLSKAVRASKFRRSGAVQRGTIKIEASASTKCEAEMFKKFKAGHRFSQESGMTMVSDDPWSRASGRSGISHVHYASESRHSGISHVQTGFSGIPARASGLHPNDAMHRGSGLHPNDAMRRGSGNPHEAPSRGSFLSPADISPRGSAFHARVSGLHPNDTMHRGSGLHPIDAMRRGSANPPESSTRLSGFQASTHLSGFHFHDFDYRDGHLHGRSSGMSNQMIPPAFAQRNQRSMLSVNPFMD